MKFSTDFKICLLAYITLREKHPVYLESMLATSLPSHTLRSHNGMTLLISWVRPTLARGVFTFVSLPCGITSRYLSIHLNCNFQEAFENSSRWLGLSSINTGPMAWWLVNVMDCFMDFVVEHWFSCHATEPSLARDSCTVDNPLIY